MPCTPPESQRQHACSAVSKWHGHVMAAAQGLRRQEQDGHAWHLRWFLRLLLLLRQPVRMSRAGGLCGMRRLLLLLGRPVQERHVSMSDKWPPQARRPVHIHCKRHSHAANKAGLSDVLGGGVLS